MLALLPGVAAVAGGFLGRDVRADGLAAPVADGPLRADRLLRGAGLESGTVLVVRAPLSARMLARVLGWTDRRRRAAVVSTSSLDLGGPRAEERLAKLVAHEAGHVLGLRHCRSPACLARPVRDHAELDARDAFCELCRLRLDRG